MISPHRCPICDKAFSRTAESPADHFPFCSDRCRKVDFHRWCDGRYAVVEDIDPQVAEFLQNHPEESPE
jgi:endogenous inhibitor of DNA gyrase (YacG/DUF329 family)